MGTLQGYLLHNHTSDSKTIETLLSHIINRIVIDLGVKFTLCFVDSHSSWLHSRSVDSFCTGNVFIPLSGMYEYQHYLPSVPGCLIIMGNFGLVMRFRLYVYI